VGKSHNPQSGQVVRVFIQLQEAEVKAPVPESRERNSD
jgi:hypothetical protein